MEQIKLKIMESIDYNKVVNNITETFNGICYKDEEAFYNNDGVCYIPEYDLDFINKSEFIEGYTREDFLNIVGGDIDEAELLFNEVRWQHPETLFNEWL